MVSISRPSGERSPPSRTSEWRMNSANSVTMRRARRGREPFRRVELLREGEPSVDGFERSPRAAEDGRAADDERDQTRRRREGFGRPGLRPHQAAQAEADGGAHELE